jgi:hypothetical protein
MENLSKTITKWTGCKRWCLASMAVAALALALPAVMYSQSLPPAVAQERSQLLNNPWDPARLYAILTSQNPQVSEDLYRAAFAAGPAIIPKLENALQDDRTAEFAAQTLAYFADAKSMAILEKLLKDPRDLDLRRFYFGALGVSANPHNVEILLNKVLASDREPDRDVTRNAILALSVSSDAALVAKLHEAETQVNDPVIQDDIDTAAMVIELRSRLMAAPTGNSAASSPEQATNHYFMPALQPPAGSSAEQQNAGVEVNVKNLTWWPDKSRALAAVDFENPEAVASYHMVLQKNQAGWKVASVWLEDEREKPQKATTPK